MSRHFGIRRIGTILFIATAALFLGAAIIRQGEQLRVFEWQIAPARLALSTLALTGAFALGVSIWGMVLRRFDIRIPFRTLARIWFLSNLGRYIPGKIWQFVGVAELSRGAGVTGILGITSLMVYMGYSLLAAWLVGIYMIPSAALGDLAGTIPLLRLASPALIAFLFPGVLNRVVDLASRVIRRPLEPWSGQWGDGVLLLTLAALQWIAYGAAFHLFVSSLVPTPPSLFPALTASFALAFVAGYVVVLAPAGLGAKEGALAALLSSMLPFPVAAAIAIAARLWTIVAELLPIPLLILQQTPLTLIDHEPPHNG